MLNITQIPDPEALIQFATYLRNSIENYQEGAQTLSTGQRDLMDSCWKGDSAPVYSETHSKMQQTGEMHMQQRMQVANMLNAAVEPLGQAKMLQENAIRLMDESRIMAADPATEAEAAELSAAAERMEAEAQEIVARIAAEWQTTLAELTGSADVTNLKSMEFIKY